jgi:hypothetical protein
MATPKERKSDDINVLAKKFLEEHPEAKKALDLFGIALEEYQQSLAAQQRPVFYTGTSTD